MPIPSPRKGQNRESFISQCMSAIGDEYENKDQALAICFGRWSDKRAKASYILGRDDNETIYIKSTVYLSAALVDKLKTFPQSGPGYHKVKVSYVSGNTYSGTVRGDEFETDGDEIEDEQGEITDIVLND